MRRFALIAPAALLTLGSVATPASAGKGWCRSDPIVSLNGVQVQFWIAMPVEYQSNVIGPIAITFVAPRASNLALVSSDSGFNGYGEAVQLAGNGSRFNADGSFRVKISVGVPVLGNQSVPLRVEITPESGGSVSVEGDATGVSITLTLQGSTISQTQAGNGAVVSYPNQSGIAASSLVSPSTPSATPTSTSATAATATATASEVPTATATTEPTNAPTVQFTPDNPATGGNQSAGQTSGAEPTATPTQVDQAAMANGNASTGAASAAGANAAPSHSDAASTATDTQPTVISNSTGSGPVTESAAPTVVGNASATNDNPAATSEPTTGAVPTDQTVTGAGPGPGPTVQPTDTPADNAASNQSSGAPTETTVADATTTANDAGNMTPTPSPTPTIAPSPTTTPSADPTHQDS